MRHLLACLLVAGCRSVPLVEAPRSQAPPITAAAAPASNELGSLRNSVVAISRGEPRTRLVYFAESLSPDELAAAKAAAPGVDFVVGLTREQALTRAAEAHAVDGQYATSEFLAAAPNLVWVQALSAGVDRYVRVPSLVNTDRVVLTNLRGIHGPSIADHVFAMLLALTRDLPVHLAARSDGRWLRDGSGELTPVALQDRTLFVVGLGGIGTEVARRAHGFGMRVIATRRGEDPAPDFVERLGKPQDLHAFLADSDVVVICVPLTSETEHMIDAAALAVLKPGAYLVNIARGKIVDTEALVAALRSKRLAGACLDVTDPEPLPPDHPLWKFSNVVITPHVAADAELTRERSWALRLENLRRFDAGEPLLNVVDKRAGY